MKLRQKLAMVLASAMIVTAVPVTTMAASVNSLNKSIAINENYQITATDDALQLIVDYTRKVDSDTFYLVAQDFEFNETYYKNEGKIGTNYEITSVSKTELEVTVSGTDLEDVAVNIVGKVLKGNPAIKVDAVNSFATASTVLLGGEVTSNKSLVATAKDATVIPVDVTGAVKVGTVVIEEKVANQVGDKIRIELPKKSDLEFVAGDVTVKGYRGVEVADETVAATLVADEDNKVLEIDLTDNATSSRPGRIEITGLQVKPENRREDLKTGDVAVKVSVDKKLDATSVVVAKVQEQDVTISVDEVDELVAGHGTTKVKVKITDITGDSLQGKDLFLTIEGGKFVSAPGLNADKDEIELNTVEQVGKKEYELEIEIAAKAGFTGDVVIKAENDRVLDETLEVKVATVEEPFTVEAEGFTVKPGVKGQKGGTITITEADAEKFGKNDTFVIKADDKEFKIQSADVEVTEGDLELYDAEVTTDGALVVKVKRTSDEASTITINNIEMTSSRYIADGAYDFVIGGEAVSDANDNAKKFEEKITLKNFVTTGELTGTVEITADADKYVKNGEKVAVPGDMGAFLNEDNRMMAPVRLIGEAFGVTLNSVSTGETTVVIAQKGNTIVKFTNGSAVMEINGMQVPMNTKAVIKNDRMFLPIRDLAFAFGIDVEWTAETNTATFTSK